MKAILSFVLSTVHSVVSWVIAVIFSIAGIYFTTTPYTYQGLILLIIGLSFLHHQSKELITFLKEG